MNQFYGIDLSEPGLLEARSGRWLRKRVEGLFAVEMSRLRLTIFPPATGKKE